MELSHPETCGQLDPGKSSERNVQLAQNETSVSTEKHDSGAPPLEIVDVERNSTPNKNDTGNTSIQIPRRHSARKRLSIEYRKLAQESLLKPKYALSTQEINDASSVMIDDDKSRSSQLRAHSFNMEDDVLRKFCLNPKFTLRKQMMNSFGSLSVCTIIVVVVICVAMAQWIDVHTKSLLKYDYIEKLADTIDDKQKYLADVFGEEFFLFDTAKLVHDVVQDRFDGYPNLSDDGVPFLDMKSKTNIYPIAADPMPFLWNLQPNVNEDNHGEFLQRRWEYFKDKSVDTTKAGFYIPLSCNPYAPIVNGSVTVTNCTESDFDVQRGGGTINNKTEMYLRKGSDLVPILRGLFEIREEILEIYIHFPNDGTGAGVLYPQYFPVFGNYTSEGCDWLLQANPYNASKTIGTESMVENCRKKGAIVPYHSYNALERGWCQEQALNPGKMFIDYRSGRLRPDNDEVIQIGTSIYDRTSKEFLACMYIGIDVNQIQRLLELSETQYEDIALLIEYGQKGNIVASSFENFTLGATKTSIYDEPGFEMMEEKYTELYNIVDFDSVWDPDEVSKAYKKFSMTEGTGKKYIMSIAPLPSIPSEYDKSYRPKFFFVAYFYKEKFQDEVVNIREVIDQNIINGILCAIVMGACGIVIAVIIIFFMAYILTTPLTNMNDMASDIVDSVGDPKKEDEIKNSKSNELVISRCTPKTELADVVCEFNKMVESFSGASEAKSEKERDEDMLNIFPARNDLFELYKSRSDKTFKYNITGERVRSRSDNFHISYMHLGGNYNESPPVEEKLDTNEETEVLRAESRKSSRLFLWILLLIVAPIILIPIAISVGVITTIRISYEGIDDAILDLTIDVAKKQTEAVTRLRSEYVSKLTERSTRDLSLLSRYSSWLLFGGLKQSNSFTQVDSVVEDCKEFGGNFSQCKSDGKIDFVCDCKWQERGYEKMCTNYTESIRGRQMNYWSAQLSKNENGDLFTSNFPDSSISPQTTNWWDNAMELPGYQNESSTSGYSTSYKRLKVLSAVPIFQVLKNYRSGKSPQATLHTSVSFEADGMIIGNSGCGSAIGNAAYSNWTSTTENNGADLRPKLCPVGKYGYDPRCREWYNAGRNQALLNQSNVLHITTPYYFGINNENQIYGQSATYAILDPRNGEHVGQTLIDFANDFVSTMLSNQTVTLGKGQPILITVNDEYGDTILGPGEPLGLASKPIAESVMPFDVQCIDEKQCERRLSVFNDIVNKMKSGEEGSRDFFRKTENGDNERMILHYAPVNIPFVYPVNSSDYATGVEKKNFQLYSLGFLVREDDLRHETDDVAKKLDKHINVGTAIITIVIIIAAATSIYMSHRLAISFSATMRHLLGLLCYINTHDDKESPLPPQGIRPTFETVVLSRTLVTLHRIIKLANTAFFAGDLGSAYRVLIDALRLFRRLDNTKAVGVASNNLGNTLLSIYREMKMLQVNELYNLTVNDVISQGIAYFHTAITLGEKTYDNFYDLQGWTPSCLNFMQHLANRYFNRGMFLLLTKDDHHDPSEIERLGMRDLQIADDMDQEVVAYGEDIGWGASERIASRFNVNITRIQGYNVLCQEGYHHEEHDWGIEELIQDTISILRVEYKKINSNLFSDMTRFGRLQMLEVQLIQYRLLQEDFETAAKIAVRMIIEDEYVFVNAMKQAVKALMKYTESHIVDADFREKMMPVFKEYLEDVGRIGAENRKELILGYSETNPLISTHDLTMSSHRWNFPNSPTSVGQSDVQDELDIFVTMEDF